MVGAVGLVIDLEGELASAPDVVGVPRATAPLDQLAGAGDDLRLPLLRELGVEHEQDFVRRHGCPESPSFGLDGHASGSGAGSGDECSIVLVTCRLAFLGGIAVAVAKPWKPISRLR